MPGLLRGVARTAVAGTAVTNRVSRRQAGRWAQQDYAQQEQYAAQQVPAPPPPPHRRPPSPMT
ncbi:hypothetical protein [Streptomyces sp. NPDC003863]